MSKALGSVLRRARKHLKLTQDQVAKRLGVSRAAVGLWEGGDDPATDNLIGICKELGIEVQAAIAGEMKHIENFQALTPPRSTSSDAQDASELSVLHKYPYNQPNYFIHNKIIPFFPTFRFEDDMFIEITQEPMIFSPREREFPQNNNLYLISVVNSNMEPIINRMTMVLVDSASVPTIGDIVLVKINNPRKSGQERPTGTKIHKSQSAIIGVLDGVLADAVTVSQTCPRERATIPTAMIAAIHKILPPSKPTQD